MASHSRGFLKALSHMPETWCNGCKQEMDKRLLNIDRRVPGAFGGLYIPINSHRLCVTCHKEKSRLERALLSGFGFCQEITEEWLSFSFPELAPRRFGPRTWVDLYTLKLIDSAPGGSLILQDGEVKGVAGLLDHDWGVRASTELLRFVDEYCDRMEAGTERAEDRYRSFTLQGKFIHSRNSDHAVRVRL